MFGNQRFERDVGQNIAAINDEWFFPKNAFDIFDPAAGFEQVRLIDERNGMTVVTVPREKFMKQVRKPVRINDKRFHAHAYQMIERKSDQRFLKDWDEGLRQLVRQWTQ